MSAKHPIIAVTGSSGAGTSTSTNAFRSMFHQLGYQAAVVEGDSFHRYCREAWRQREDDGALDRTLGHPL